MNCSEFNLGLKELVETRGASSSESLLAHAVSCQVCRQQWCDHLLLEAALRAWHPISSPSLVNGVLRNVFEDHERQQTGVGTLESRRRWLVVAIAAACLLIALRVGMTSRFDSGDRNLALNKTGHSIRTSQPDAGSVDEPPVGVASSVAAVFEDLRSEYDEFAAETRATYAGLGSLVTRRWINCRPKKGPTLGWLNSASSAIFRASSPDAPAGTVVPRKRAGKEEWRYPLPKSVHTGVSGDAFSVYVGCRDGSVYALDRKSGKLRWKTSIGGAVLSCPAVAASGGWAVAVYAVSQEGLVVCLHPQTGAAVWQKPLPGFRWDGTATGGVLCSPVVVTAPTATGSTRTVYVGAMTVDPQNPVRKTVAVFKFEDVIGE